MPVIPPPSIDSKAGTALGPELVTRRRALQVLAGSALALGLGACGSGGGGAAADAPFDLWAAIADAARADDPRLTARRAATELGLALDACAVRRADAQERERLVSRMSEDFAAGRTVLVAGWLLSRTEVLLAVIVAEAL